MSVVKLTVENFEQEVLQAEKPVLVDFYADWCGPCKMMSPIVDEIAEEESEIKVCNINIDQAMEIAQKYRVMSIPTFIAFKNGEEAGRHCKNNSRYTKFFQHFFIPLNRLIFIDTRSRSVPSAFFLPAQDPC